MGISDKTRKRLWAKSGNRCAISKIELVFDPTGKADDSVIGEECHIAASSPGGPRFVSTLSEDQLDSYDNLVLLSRNYHKIVDDNPQHYNVERLRTIKKGHERWVKETLDFAIRNVKSRKDSDLNVSFLHRVTNGSALLAIVGGAHGSDFDNDELHDEAEVKLVAGFLQNAQDWGELFDGLESGERVRAKHSLSRDLQEIEDNGFWVFGAAVPRRLRFGDETSTWRIAVLRVLRSDNPTILRFDLGEGEPPEDANDTEHQFPRVANKAPRP